LFTRVQLLTDEPGEGAARQRRRQVD